MNRFLIAICFVLVITCMESATLTYGGCHPSTQSDGTPSNTRQVTVEISVASEGQALAGIPFTVRSMTANATGITGAGGRARIEVACPLSARMVAVFPAPTIGGEARLTVAQAKDIHERKISPFAFNRWYRVALEPERQIYQLAIDVPRGRTASVLVTNPKGESIANGGVAPDVTLNGKFVRATADGVMVIRGLPLGVASSFYVIARDGRVFRIGVPAGDGDVDLGKVVVDENSTAECEVKVGLNTTTAAPWRPESAVYGATLVSMDGERIYALQHRPPTSYVVFAATHPAIPRVRAGEYYVVGSSFAATPGQLAVIERARAGEDLRAAGVPTITAKTGTVAELDIDVWGVEKSILGEDNMDRPASPTGGAGERSDLP